MHLTGRFSPHPRGFGFVDAPEPVSVTAPDGSTKQVDSLFVPPPVARGWLADDVVTAEIELDDEGRANAASLRLLDRPRRFVVGTLETFAGSYVLRPDPKLASGQLDVAEALATKVGRAEGRQVVAMVTSGPDGQAVAGTLVAGPEPATAPTALRARAVVIAHGGATPESIPGGPQAIGLPVAETAGNALRTTGYLASGRTGLAAGMDASAGTVPGAALSLSDRRDETTITIDADTSRDLDDALSAVWSGEAEDPVRLSVHIADASGGVGMGSDADRYAATMGTTTYFVSGPHAPMLDPALSEGELSLLPGEPRRVITVVLDVAADGSTTTADVDVSWIQTTARLSYAAVDAYLDDEDPFHLTRGAHGLYGADLDDLGDVRATVDALAEASSRLGIERDGRDSLDVLFAPEALEATTIDGKIRAVPADPHPAAQRLVERAMVATNEAIASWAAERNLPLLYRSHVGFDPARLDTLHAAAEAADAKLPDEPAPEDVLRLVADLRGTGRDDAAATVATAAASAVARAAYTAEPSGHGALGGGHYTHFTSPIRRYSDLVVHRQVRAALAGDAAPYDAAQLEALGAWLDARAGAASYAQTLERQALWGILLQRGAVRWPAEAVITGVSPNGLRVRLIEPGVGGFISAAKALGEPSRSRASLDIDEHGLGTTDGRFRIGARIRVRLDRIDPLFRPDLEPA